MISVEQKIQLVQAIDKKLRGNIADLYMSLNDLGDPARSIELLSIHAAMLVNMINDIKGRHGIDDAAGS